MLQYKEKNFYIGGIMFIENDGIVDSITKTKYGSVRIQNVIFDPQKIEAELPDLVLTEKNLMHMFAEKQLDDMLKYNILNRFIPQEGTGVELSKYIDDEMKSNKNFYSFLSEGILGLVFRDVYGYELAKAVIDLTDTLTDTHSGVDSCMYNLEESIIVLGEAKFYATVEDGLKSIIKDFKKNKIKNKLLSLQRAAMMNSSSQEIVLKNLEKRKFDSIPVQDFLRQKIIFAGFVLHSESKDVSRYKNDNFYFKHSISVDELIENINKSLNINIGNTNFEIILIHLPIQDKKTLIEKIIDKAASHVTVIRKAG